VSFMLSNYVDSQGGYPVNLTQT